MPTPHLDSPSRPDLITLELGASCYVANVLHYEHELKFEPLPAGAPRLDHVCGVIRLRDGSTIPVFDLRSRQRNSPRHRLLVTIGYHGEERPVGTAFLLDAAERTPPRSRHRARRDATPPAFSRN